MVNDKLEEFKKYIKGRKVAFVGLGTSNVPAIKYLNRLGARITGFDDRDAQKLGDICVELESLGINLSLGEGYLEDLAGFDVIFRSPSARPDKPEFIKEINRGAILTSEIELVMEMCPGKIIGVTGSAGKTTTSVLIYEMLKAQELDCYIGGNIGITLLDKVEQMDDNTVVVLELSSFQLMTMKVSPNIAIITALAPDHLDVHTSVEEYYESKENIFKYQSKQDKLILNYDNDLVRNLRYKTQSQVKFFSAKEKLTDGIIIDDGKIKLAENKIRKHILNVNDIAMIGVHNQMNLCAAILAVEGIVSYENIQKVALTFTGVEHRMEILPEKNGIKYINNSIASSPIKAISSLYSFDNKIILIAGGIDRNLDFTDFAKAIIEKVKVLVLVGNTKEKIKETVLNQLEQTQIPVDLKLIECDGFEEVIKKANQYAKDGDIVMLSPGCASFDFFKDYKERGNFFKKLVEEI